jgi:hypothetical protein
MLLSPAAFPVMFPDQFTQVTGGLVLLVVELALLVIVAAILAIQATSDTKNQMRYPAHDQVKSRSGRDSSRVDCVAASKPLSGSPTPKRST